ncbi:hypothetical protein PMAYCL1PPCAC_05918, partial [Pristionchus mayeri]
KRKQMSHVAHFPDPVPCRMAACPSVKTTEESAHGRMSLISTFISRLRDAPSDFRCCKRMKQAIPYNKNGRSAAIEFTTRKSCE